jgi:tRNA pseudouridine65 synthase
VLHVQTRCQTPRHVPPDSPTPPSLPTSFPLPVLWQDDRIVVVDKPAGRLVHNSAWAGPPEETVVDVARRCVAEGLVPVHRLDRGTSGALLLARSGDDARVGQAALADPASTKRYIALVRGHVRAAIDIDHPLRDDDDDHGPRLPAHSRVTPVLLSDRERCSLVLIDLRSGRRHQARRHCKHVSHPVLGDATHGKGPLNRAYRDRFGLARLALHCARLALPTAGIDICAPLPDDLRRPMHALFPAVDVDAAVASAVLR